MKKGGGKSKGSSFERSIAKKIVKGFKSFGIEQRECWRSVLSGGHEISAGDLYLSNRLMKLFPWAVECKFRKKIRWENFLLGDGKSEEVKWVRQALDGAKKIEGLSALLVLKANHCPIFVIKKVQKDLGKPVLFLLDTWWVVQPWLKFIKDAVEEAKLKHRRKIQ